MFQVVWEFRVQPGREAEFEERYGADGDWVRLFRRADGYVETVVLRELETPGRYLVTDTWRERGAYLAFKEGHAEPYATLDAQCEELTVLERKIGEFEVA